MQLTKRSVETLKPKAKPYEVRDDTVKGFLVRVQPTGSMFYYLAYRNAEGKKQRYRIGTHGTISAMQARDAAEKKAGEVALDVDVHKARKETREEVERNKAKTLRTFLEGRYKPWIIAQRKSGERTVQMIEGHFSDLMETPLDEITLWNIEKWRAERRKSGSKPATINRNIAALKSMLSKAVEWEVIEHSPLAKLKPLKVDAIGKVRYLNTPEEQRLRQALDAREQRMREARKSHSAFLVARGGEPLPEIPTNQFADHLKPMVLLSMNTGLRRGELFALTWENVNLSKATLTVVGETAKSGRTRHVPLNKEALETLKKWRVGLKTSGLVFPSRDGNQRDNVKKAWQGLLVDAKIKDFRWHDLRHHFASALVMHGVDLNTVRELLGHASLDMTLRYAHLAPEHKAEAVARLVRG